jgi:biotin transport system substrate-specific component
MNYTDIIITQKALPSRITNIALILGTSWLIAIGAQISIQLPFSPVPITAQTLVVLLAGLILGKNRGAAAVGSYLAQGALGLPIFAGGKSGWLTLTGPTGGYLFGFLAAVYVVGLISEMQFKRSVPQAATAMVIGNLIIYAFGLIWLARFVGENNALQLGLYPFLVGDLLKISLGVVLVGGSSLLISKIKTNRDLA